MTIPACGVLFIDNEAILDELMEIIDLGSLDVIGWNVI